MIKFKLTTDDGKVKLGLGISDENVRRLKRGEPIYVNLNEMGIEAELMIMYGRTEAEIVKELKPFIGKETTIHGTND